MTQRGRQPSWVLDAAELRKIPKELQQKKIKSIRDDNYEPDPLEQVFVDDPRAEKEQEPLHRRSTNR